MDRFIIEVLVQHYARAALHVNDKVQRVIEDNEEDVLEGIAQLENKTESH